MDNVQWTLVSSLYRSIIVIVFPIVLNLPLDSFFSEWFAVVHKEETKTWKFQAYILRYFLYLNFPNFTKLLLICFETPSLIEPESSPSLRFRVGCWHFGLFLKRAIHPSLPLWHPLIDESKPSFLQNSWHFGYMWLSLPYSVSVLKAGSQILGQFPQRRDHLQVLNEIRLLLQ